MIASTIIDLQHFQQLKPLQQLLQLQHLWRKSRSRQNLWSKSLPPWKVAFVIYFSNQDVKNKISLQVMFLYPCLFSSLLSSFHLTFTFILSFHCKGKKNSVGDIYNLLRLYGKCRLLRQQCACAQQNEFCHEMVLMMSAAEKPTEVSSLPRPAAAGTHHTSIQSVRGEGGKERINLIQM